MSLVHRLERQDRLIAMLIARADRWLIRAIRAEERVRQLEAEVAGRVVDSGS